MSQTTLTSFYNSRKRPATDDISNLKNKIPHIERALESSVKANGNLFKNCNSIIHEKKNQNDQTAGISGIKADQETSTKETVKIPIQIKEITPFAKKTNANNVPKPPGPSRSEVICNARKELSLGDIRKRLASSPRLAELKASADRITKGIKQLKEASEKKNLKEFKSIDVEVPSSPSKKLPVKNEFKTPKEPAVPASQQNLLLSPRKVVVSPIKSPSKVPAYVRHAALASSGLPLPHHYRFLTEIFRAMETVVSLMYNRHEKITFTKLKPYVQEMLKRTFNEKHLAQIKFLVPDFYNFEVEKIKNFSASTHKDAFELVILPYFPNDIKSMGPTVILERRRYFSDTLLRLVKKHHTQFLLTLDPPMVIPDDKLVRWHPEFELEKAPEVESAKLPEMPNVEKLSTAQDVLAKARELFKCNTKMERAMEKLAQEKNRGLTLQEKVVTGLNDSASSISGVTLLNPALRNLPASLLEKVKAKQAAKALEAMTRSSEDEQKYIIYSRLPDLARTLRNIYVTERKNVLALNIILSKLDSTFKSNVSANDLQRDIKHLSKEVPDFVKIYEVRNTTYLKLDKNADLNSIISKLEALANKYKRE